MSEFTQNYHPLRVLKHSTGLTDNNAPPLFIQNYHPHTRRTLFQNNRETPWWRDVALIAGVVLTLATVITVFITRRASAKLG